jgi:hypothetical protein
MPKVSLADSVNDWNNLIANASRHAADAPAMAVWIEELRVIQEQALETEALRMRLDAERQVATHTLSDAKRQGKLLAIKIRSQLKAIYGPTSPALSGFGIRPRRIRKGRLSTRFSSPRPPLPRRATPKNRTRPGQGAIAQDQRRAGPGPFRPIVSPGSRRPPRTLCEMSEGNSRPVRTPSEISEGSGCPRRFPFAMLEGGRSPATG